MYSIMQCKDGRVRCVDNDRYVILDLTKGMTEDMIREEAKKNGFNGTYIHKICKNCGAYWIDERGNLKTALIVDQCNTCFDDENKEE